MEHGKYNVAVGLFTIAAFAAYGFILIYLRDFSPDKEAWILGANNGAHFEAKLAHVHGNLLALLNVVIGFVLARANGGEKLRRWAAGLALFGLLMPIGILAEVLLGVSPIFVLLGAMSTVAGMVATGLVAWKHWGPVVAAP